MKINAQQHFVYLTFWKSGIKHFLQIINKTYFHGELKLCVRTFNGQRYGKEFYAKAVNSKLLTCYLKTKTNKLSNNSFLTVR